MQRRRQASLSRGSRVDLVLQLLLLDNALPRLELKQPFHYAHGSEVWTGQSGDDLSLLPRSGASAQKTHWLGRT